MFYSKSTKGFYDSVINSVIPSDAVEISTEYWQSLLEAQSQGQIIEADSTGYPKAVNHPAPTREQTIAIYNQAAQQNLDAVAESWEYSSIVSAVSYANSTNPQYKADAEALIAWRDETWKQAYTIEAGATLPLNVESFLAMLPAEPVKPVI
jgi:hypothetical protein